MQILQLEASLLLFRCAKSLFQVSLVVKTRDFVVFRVVLEFLVRIRHM